MEHQLVGFFQTSTKRQERAAEFIVEKMTAEALQVAKNIPAQMVKPTDVSDKDLNKPDKTWQRMAKI